MRDGRNGIFFWALWEPKRLSMAAAAGGWVDGWIQDTRAVALLFAGAKRAPSCGERGFASIAVFNEQLDRFLVYKSIISLLYLGSNSDDPWLVLPEADILGSLTRGPSRDWGGVSQQRMKTISALSTRAPSPCSSSCSKRRDCMRRGFEKLRLTQRAIPLPMLRGLRTGGGPKSIKGIKSSPASSLLTLPRRVGGEWPVTKTSGEVLLCAVGRDRTGGPMIRAGQGAGTFDPRAPPPLSQWLFGGGGDMVMRELVYGERVGAGTVHVQLTTF